ncbi:serine/arginine-rich splicing factor RS31-like protein isoform X2 [Tanacetum coccineum]
MDVFGNFQKHLWLSIVETGFVDLTFVYFEDERDAEDAINALDNTAFGYDKRKFSVEWARFETQEEATKALEYTHMRDLLIHLTLVFDCDLELS